MYWWVTDLWKCKVLPLQNMALEISLLLTHFCKVIWFGNSLCKIILSFQFTIGSSIWEVSEKSLHNSTFLPLRIHFLSYFIYSMCLFADINPNNKQRRCFRDFLFCHIIFVSVYSKDNDGGMTAQLPSTVTSFVQTGLRPGEEYTINLVALRDQGRSQPVTATFTTRTYV